MFAVIKTGGKQYKVAADDVVKVEKLEGEAGDTVTFDSVLMVGEGSDVTVGTPLVEGASVAAELVETKKQKKVLVFKKNRRHNYRRRNGHRQTLSTVRITDILTGGKKPAAARKAAPRTENKAAEKPAEKAAPKAESKPEADAAFKDDLKQLSGVGPALEKKLAAAGVTSLKQIAEITPEEIERVEGEINASGRFERDGWVAQAKDLIAGKADKK